jgi:hypothetical protein
MQLLIAGMRYLMQSLIAGMRYLMRSRLTCRDIISWLVWLLLVEMRHSVLVLRQVSDVLVRIPVDVMSVAVDPQSQNQETSHDSSRHGAHRGALHWHGLLLISHC